MASAAIEPDEGFDVVREGKEVEELEPAQDEAGGAQERLEVALEAFGPAGEVDETGRRIRDHGLQQPGSQTPPRRVGQQDLRVREQVEMVLGGTGVKAGASAMRRGSGRQCHFEAPKPIGTAFIEADGAGLGEQAESDRSDPGMKLGQGGIGWDEFANALDRALEEGQVVLPEGARREEDRRAGQLLAEGLRTGESGHPGAEDRVGPIRLGIEEKALEAISEAAFDGRRKVPEDAGIVAPSDEHDLDPAARSFDHELQVAKDAAMGAIRIGRDARFTNRLPDRSSRFVDPRMMDGTSGHVDDPMGARLEEADLRVLRATADRESGAMTVGEAWCAVDGGLGKPRCASESGQRCHDAGRRIGLAEAGAARTGRAMGTIF